MTRRGLGGVTSGGALISCSSRNSYQRRAARTCNCAYMDSGCSEVVNALTATTRSKDSQTGCATRWSRVLGPTSTSNANGCSGLSGIKEGEGGAEGRFRVHRRTRISHTFLHGSVTHLSISRPRYGVSSGTSGLKATSSFWHRF